MFDTFFCSFIVLAITGVVADNVYRGEIRVESIMGVFTVLLYVVSDDHAGWLLVRMKNRLKICDSSTSETDFNFTWADYVYENGVDVKYEKRTRHLVTFRYAEKNKSERENFELRRIIAIFVVVEEAKLSFCHFHFSSLKLSQEEECEIN